ncbi:hypothetical protein MMC27_000774 [Xylographa pallens]|nr:hypothetical protein [Xylographa pallens]
MQGQGSLSIDFHPKTVFSPEDRLPRGGDAKLRDLSLDGGGIKGLTSLLVLRRIMRTMKIEANLDEEPRPCDVFDVIGGTSTGGLIAVMLGRLGMTVDEAITQYKLCGKSIFGKPSKGGDVGKFFATARGKAWYSIQDLRKAVQDALPEPYGLDEPFVELEPLCRTFVCVTRNKTGAAEVLRNYKTRAASQEDFECLIWEPGCATAAAPLYFDSVTLVKNKETFSDGGLNRNNPIREAIAESNRIWPHRHFGSVVSLGTGWLASAEISKRPDKLLKKCIEMLTDSEKIAADFESEKFAVDLMQRSSYFRFNVQQGMQDVELSDWKEEEKMSALTNQYLARCGPTLQACARSLLDPGEEYSSEFIERQPPLPVELCQNFKSRSSYVQWLRDAYAESRRGLVRVALWGLGGTGKTQVTIKFALEMMKQARVFWVLADTLEHFIVDYESCLEPIILIIDNADSADMFLEPTIDGVDLGACLPSCGFTIFTTRDSRIVGSITESNQGLHIKPMEMEEASDLFIKSLPPELAHPDNPEFIVRLEWLLNQLGYLPLAVAQLATTMRECRMTMKELVALFEDAKSKAKILQRPIRELRSHSQSVLLTWEVTFSKIEALDTNAATLLMSLVSFHWSGIPIPILAQLVSLAKCDRLGITAAVGLLVNFSIAQKTEVGDSFSELQVHPLVHFWIEHRLTKDELFRYLLDALDVMAAVFRPPDSLESSRIWNAYILPHAIRLIGLCEEAEIEAPTFARLLQIVAAYYGDRSSYGSAIEMINRAETLSLRFWPENSSSRYLIMKFKAIILCGATRYNESEALYRKCYRELVCINDDHTNKAEETRDILLKLIGVLRYTGIHLPNTDDVVKDALFQVLESPDMSRLEAVEHHNLANAFRIIERYDLCEKFSNMAFEKINAGEKVAESSFLAMLNMQAHIKLHKGLEDEALDIYLSVFERSLQILDRRNLDLWVNALNVCPILVQRGDWSKLDDLLIRLFEDWDDSLEGRAQTKAAYLLNMLGVSFQRQGRSEKSRMLHVTALKMFSQSLKQSDAALRGIEEDNKHDKYNSDLVGQSDLDLALYNIAMSFVRERNWEAASKSRATNVEAIARVEKKFRTLELRRDEFEADCQIYLEAETRFQQLQSSPVADRVNNQRAYDEWYETQKEALERAILFYGPLKSGSKVEAMEERGAPKASETHLPKDSAVDTSKNAQMEKRKQREAEQKSRRFWEVFGRFRKNATD